MLNKIQFSQTGQGIQDFLNNEFFRIFANN